MSSQSQPNLRIPGPVPLPDDILEIAGSQMINHRGPEFREMILSITENLKKERRLHSGMIQLQLHDPGMVVKFKDLQIKVLK